MSKHHAPQTIADRARHIINGGFVKDTERLTQTAVYTMLALYFLAVLGLFSPIVQSLMWLGIIIGTLVAMWAIRADSIRNRAEMSARVAYIRNPRRHASPSDPADQLRHSIG